MASDNYQRIYAVVRKIPRGRVASYGQIARADGQFSGFHNCTAVVCVLPE